RRPYGPFRSRRRGRTGRQAGGADRRSGPRRECGQSRLPFLDVQLALACWTWVGGGGVGVQVRWCRGGLGGGGGGGSAGGSTPAVPVMSRNARPPRRSGCSWST